MATHARFDNSTIQRDGRPTSGEEPQMRDLLKQLASEGSDLLRGEVALAKLEMRDMAREVAMDSARLMGSLTFVMLGAVALLAATVIGVGHLLDDRYGLAALVTGIVLVAVGAFIAKSGINRLKNADRPHIGESLKRDKEWAAAEVRELKQGVKG
jgi:uncharacterized membrane protein YqjE